MIAHWLPTSLPSFERGIDEHGQTVGYRLSAKPEEELTFEEFNGLFADSPTAQEEEMAA